MLGLSVNTSLLLVSFISLTMLAVHEGMTLWSSSLLAF